MVAFSAGDVYAIAELIRRQRGGAAVVLGALSPRTRNAQVALYQSGDVDFLVATDAVGMGLNLDVDHVAFAATRKFDGLAHRNLTAGELGQIAGRAGRHMNDGTFGVTGDVEPFDSELIERLEHHHFDQVKTLQWRNSDLDFSTLEALQASLQVIPRHKKLTRARSADDVVALEAVSRDPEIARLATSPAAIKRLWEVCQIPDYRKISPPNHAELVASLYKYLLDDYERVPEDWFADQVAQSDRTDGEIDTLANRLAHVRTWTFVSNRADWLERPEYWQERTREIEDRLSDALHEQLTQRFVDRRTSTLIRRMRDSDDLFAEISDDGAMYVEKHYVGRLQGFCYVGDAAGDGIHGKAARNAAAKVLDSELQMRARRVASARPEALVLGSDGAVMWRGEKIAVVEAGDDPLRPKITLLADEHLRPADRDKIQERLDKWFDELIEERLGPLLEIGRAEDVTGLARGVAFRLTENFGILKREDVGAEIRQLDQPARGQLRKYGVRFGAFNIYFPVLLKPAPSELLTLFWRLSNADKKGGPEAGGPTAFALPRAGLTSVAGDPAVPEAYYRVGGYHLCGPRAVRIDMLERLSDMIRPLIAWRARADGDAPPSKGATGDGGFTVQPEMMSILGCSAEQLGDVLKALGFRLERRLVAGASATPVPVEDAAEEGNATSDGPGSTVAGGVASATPPGDTGRPEPDQSAEPAKPAVDTISTAATANAPAREPEALSGDGETQVTEPEFVEIWRPRGRASGQTHQHRRARTARDRAARAKQGGGRTGSPIAEQRKTRRDKGVEPARDRPRPARQSGGAPARDGGDTGARRRKRPEADPDSPFAALSKLKEQLEKQDPGKQPPS